MEQELRVEWSGIRVSRQASGRGAEQVSGNTRGERSIGRAVEQPSEGAAERVSGRSVERVRPVVQAGERASEWVSW
jgi:hypothetical protein